ncbi:hypothetical protein [Streptomyces atratus]|uniref:hypothetical protein n=1 Tax=Streptomyces atratus TaxID=1893 RepID=UPI003243B2CE
MTASAPSQASAPDAEYRTLLGHTLNCAACRAGSACPTVVRLGRAWRETRGPAREARR